MLPQLSASTVPTPYPLLMSMDAFTPVPPEWTNAAVHAHAFCCPTCRETTQAAQRVWINRRSPVYSENRQRKWQEFYQCECGTAWWAWSSDRPIQDWQKPNEPQ